MSSETILECNMDLLGKALKYTHASALYLEHIAGIHVSNNLSRNSNF